MPENMLGRRSSRASATSGSALSPQVSPGASSSLPMSNRIPLREATMANSIYALTEGALEMPKLSSGPIPTPPVQLLPLPPYLLHCTLFASYDMNPPHPVPFCSVGCPATYSRSNPNNSANASAASSNKADESSASGDAASSSSSSSAANKLSSKLNRKRLGVQIPLTYLGSPPPNQTNTELYAYLPHPKARNGADLAARVGNLHATRKISLFQAQAKELTDIVSRPLIERVVSAIYSNQGVYSRCAVFPIQAVLTYGAQNRKGAQSQNQLKKTISIGGSDQKTQKKGFWSKFKPSSKISHLDTAQIEQQAAPPEFDPSSPPKDGVDALEESHSDEGPKFVKVPMVFATLDMLAPPSRLLESGGPFPVEMNHVNSDEANRALQELSRFDRMTDEERFSCFHLPWTTSEKDKEFMNQTLRALERRGGIWLEAARMITPSSRNPFPHQRYRYLVKGIFPEQFVNRCKFYRRNANKKGFTPMPYELDPKEVAKFGHPVYTHTIDERVGNQGIDLADFTQNNETSAIARSNNEGRMESTRLQRVGSRTESTRTSRPGDEDTGMPLSPSSGMELDLEWEWDEENPVEPIRQHADEDTEYHNDVSDPLPSYTHISMEKLQGFGTDSRLALELVREDSHFFTGWSIGVTEEPFRSGGHFEILGSGPQTWAMGIGGGVAL